MDWMEEDLGIFEIKLNAKQMASLDKIQTGRRTCPDCWTQECEGCAATLIELGCPIKGHLPVPGKGNPNATQCIACAGLPAHSAKVTSACGPRRGETLETLVAKACGA